MRGPGAAVLRCLGSLLCLWALRLPAGPGAAARGLDVASYRERVRAMFYHAYEHYLESAFPYDELRPLTCDGQDTWGSFSLTLIDALDTLLILGNVSEFQRVVNVLQEGLDFDIDVNASVFETNIRVVGGLLSAHLLSRKAGVEVEAGWPCSGPLLRMAEEAARKLLPAFQTPTGMPYGTVNLLHGVNPGETPVTCTAGIGTFIVEFATLSHLTGDPVFEDVARKALKALWKNRSDIGLVSEEWTWTVLLSIKDLRDHRLDNRMESFFLAETIKYLYLLFDPDNFIHNDGSDFDVVVTPYGECVLNAGGYIFNTEAHPIDPAALHCCRKRKEEQWEVEDLMREFYSLKKTKKFTLKRPSDPGEGESAKDPEDAEKTGEKRRSKKSSHSLLSCPSQSFNSKLAVLGQVFLDNT
ncbi:PREDICTED: ER degradation-enhancing alpha-mannosidase-like protein 2 [Lepidothrix coronata]|uniref:alpha-1,2-Mannosidase n=1 Tax=Lepidothrix coronata TaxID=321398 RepID=A0A6J0J145_9PASS|nr:PREDICTED: ER degradation-enhancing alpha-mannosidase-like protein 2 [Lepidothrix coronata]